MADPIDELKSPQPSRTEAWVRRGVTKDPEKARRRVAASRKTRRAPRAKSAVTTSCPYDWTLAIEMISDRCDVPRAWVIKKFIEEGIRKHGNPAEREAARLDTPAKTNAFDPMTPQNRPVFPGDVQTPAEQAEYAAGYDGYQMARGLPTMFGGLPVSGRADSITGPIEEEVEDDQLTQ